MTYKSRPTIDEKKVIGNRLREFSREKGIGLQDIAKKLGRSYQSVISYEQGVLPPAEIARKYCEILGKEMYEIFGYWLAKDYEKILDSVRISKLREQKINIAPEVARMRKDREVAGLSLEDVVEKVKDILPGLSTDKGSLRATLSKIERGERELTYEFAVVYAYLLGKNPEDYFLEKEEERILVHGEHTEDENLSRLQEETFDEMIRRAGVLTREEREILHSSYSENKTLEEIGKKNKVTRERIRQIKNKALEKLRGQYTS